MSKALYELTLCRLRVMRREPSALFFTFLFPTLIMLGVYLTLDSNEPTARRVAITHQNAELLWSELLTSHQHLSDQHSSKEAFFASFEDFELIVDDKATVHHLLDQKKVHGAVIIQSAQDDAPRPLIYALAGSKLSDDPQTQRQQPKQHKKILSNVNQEEAMWVMASFHAEMLHKLSPKDSRSPTYEFYQPSDESQNSSLLTEFLAITLLTNTLFGLGMSLVMARREGILKRYLTTPMQNRDFVVSYFLSRQLLMVAETALIMGLGYVLFSFRISGSLILFMAITSLATFMLSALTFTLASRASNTSTYNALANLCLFPMILFSGAFFATTDLPIWLQKVTALLPLTPVASSLKAVAAGGADLAAILPQVGLITFYAALFAALSHYLFVWYDP